MLREVTKETIINAIKWSEDIQRLDQSLGDCTFLIFELLSSVSKIAYILTLNSSSSVSLFKRNPAGSITSCAWPRSTGTKHILVIGTGCPSTAGKDKEYLARDLAIHAASKILGEEAEKYYLPNGIEDFRDPKKVLLLSFQWYFQFSHSHDRSGDLISRGSRV